METKEIGIIDLNKQGKIKVKCYKFFSPELERNLMIHEDIDAKKHSSVSDEITGYRLFSIPENIHSLKFEYVQEKLNKFIRHFTLEEIKKEFKKAESNCLIPKKKKGGTHEKN